jgi:hypothetical protein
MVITSSNVRLGSDYSYSQDRYEVFNYTGFGSAGENVTDFLSSTLPQAMDSENTENGISAGINNNESDVLSLLLNNGSSIKESIENNTLSGLYSSNAESMDNVHAASLKNMLEFISGGKKISSKEITPQELFLELLNGYKDRFKELTRNYESGLVQNNTGIYAGEEISSVSKFETENEELSFYSSGTVKTQDGKTIDFDIAAKLTRSFTKNTDVKIDYGSAELMDPLVINLSGQNADVSDETFTFDIDSDGKEDNISLLAKNCGFLALDLNGDGKINNGSELFGTSSGDGFKDLAVYDMDGNGWIDENDEVFNHLKIWRKDEDGNDVLAGLGVAGIGAIYLGSSGGSFSLNNSITDETEARIKSSGIYLNEDGSSGIINDVDMALR